MSDCYDNAMMIAPDSTQQRRITLAIETSNVPGSIAISDPQGNVHEVTEVKEAGTRSQHLIVMIRDLLSTQGLSTTDISRILVSQGPGSFTGLRIGIVTAKTLAYALNCELFAIPTFELLAWQFSQHATSTPSKLCVLGDAFRGQLFVQRFHFANNSWTPLEAVHMESPTSFTASLSTTDIVIGPGVAKIKANLTTSQMVEQEAINTPKAASLLSYSSKSPQPLNPTSPFELTPLYIRASAAEEKRLEAQL